MQAMHIAAEGGLPKELLQRVQLLEVLAAKTLKLEYDAFAEFHVRIIFLYWVFSNLREEHKLYELFSLANVLVSILALSLSLE